jgi:DNA-binding LacI/PurR family transcriptional regulator
MKDIAQIAGVSTVTVSKALAGMRGVSENKRREILRLADEMGYVPPEQTQPERVEGYRIHILTAERA